MTKRYEEVTKVQRSLVAMTCDICGEESHGGPGREPVWSGDFDRVNIHIHVDKSAYFLDGDSEHEEFDICPECWETKLVPFILRKGKPNAEKT